MTTAREVIDRLLTFAPPAYWQCECARAGACDTRDDPVEAGGTGRGTVMRDTPACRDVRLRYAISTAGQPPAVAGKEGR